MNERLEGQGHGDGTTRSLSCFGDAVPPCRPAVYIKHPPRRRTKIEDTTHGPARYRAGLKRAEVEWETVKKGRQFYGEAHKGEKTVYLRLVDEVIGWDMGLRATWSYVECSNGLSPSTRRFHGRPMCHQNPTLVRLLKSANERNE